MHLRFPLAGLLALTLAGCVKPPAGSGQVPAPGDPNPAPEAGSGVAVQAPPPEGGPGAPEDGAEGPEGSAPAPTPSSRPFEGRFSGDGLTLELAQVGMRLGGTVALRGQLFPVRARQEGQELVGVFTSKGREFELRARVEGEGLVLESSKTYTLAREESGDPLAEWTEGGTSAELRRFGGDYLGALAGRPASLKLFEVGADQAGDLSCGGARYSLHGVQGLRTCSGFLRDAENGQRMTFELTFGDAPGVLDLTLTVAGADGAQKHLVVRFQRIVD